MNKINEPLTLPNDVSLTNRIVKSAMSEALGDENNNPSPALINLFSLWGNSGAGILLTGNTPVDRNHLEHAGNFVLDESTDMSKVSELVKAAKGGGAKFLAQLAHAGRRQTPYAVNPSPTSISDVQLALPGYGKPTPATGDRIKAIISKFARSAFLAQELGFDGVEIHAAHGYLLSSSLSPRINNRTDGWGGSVLENRARIVLEVVRAVRMAVNPEFIVAVKLNSSDFQKGGFDHKDSVKVAAMLEAEGVDFIEISGGNFEAPTAYQHTSKNNSTVAREAYFLDYASSIKKALNIPLMVTGGFRTSGVMNEAIDSGKTDLIGIGRPFISDPGIAQKLLSGTIEKASTIEQEFPAASDLPRGAVLNWFCNQIAVVGSSGTPDLSIPVLEGHEAYLRQIETATRNWTTARREKCSLRICEELHAEGKAGSFSKASTGSYSAICSKACLTASMVFWTDFGAGAS